MSEFFSDAQNWVLISFFVFVVLAYKLGRGSVTSALDAHIETARRDVAEAENLRVEAQELLSDYQRMKRETASEAKEVLKTAEEHAQKIREKAARELDAELARREEQLKERLSLMEAQAIEDMRSYAADLAIKATREIIIANIDSKKAKSLNDKAIADIEDSFAA
jgi:F-type H+-transporting ATPase subunit b|tara:strand:+ start:129546 stop:130040 length:495 start_codon:yes stop_codon:yes gene_type:complete